MWQVVESRLGSGMMFLLRYSLVCMLTFLPLTLKPATPDNGSTCGAPDVLWTRSYGTPDQYQVFVDMVVHPDGSLTLLENTRQNDGTDDYNLRLIRTDALGDTLWTQTYGTPTSSHFAYGMAMTPDNGYLLTGKKSAWFTPDSITPSRAFLMKTSATGAVEWTLLDTTVTSSFSRGTDVIPVQQSGFLWLENIWTNGTPYSEYDTHLVRVNVDGTIRWRRTFGGDPNDYGSGIDEGRTVIQTADGGFAFAGYTDSFIPGGFNGWLVKTDSLGYQEWQQIYWGAGRDWWADLQQLEDGGYILVGATDSRGPQTGLPSEHAYNFWVARTTAQGDTLWTTVFGDSIWADHFNSVLSLGDSAYFAGGIAFYYGKSVPAMEYTGTLLDSSGQIVWTCQWPALGESGANEAKTIVQHPAGGFVVGGDAQVYSGGGFQLKNTWIVRLSALLPAPQPVTLLTPIDSSVIASDSLVTFDWSAGISTARQTLRYAVRLQADSSAWDTLFTISDTTLQWSLPSHLRSDTLSWDVATLWCQDTLWSTNGPWQLQGAAPTHITAPSPGLPERVSLSAGYPNPFNSMVRWRYGVPQQTTVTAQVFDLQGRRIRTLVDRAQQPGWHTLTWDGRNQAGVAVASGIYLLQLRIPTRSCTTKVVYLR